MSIDYDNLGALVDNLGAPEYALQADSEAELIALAPDMARELLRLRLELTDLRDLMHSHAVYQRADGYGTAANWTSDHAHRLARILEGADE